MIAYKVLRRIKGKRLVSCGNIPESLRYHYKVEIVNYPRIKESKFFVFKDKDLSIRFKNALSGRNLEIWSCEVPDLKRVRDLPRVWDYKFNLNEIKKYWNGSFDLALGLASGGCHKTSSIKLIKKEL